MRRRALTSLFVFLLALAFGCCIFLSACDGAGENGGQNNGGQNNGEDTNEELPVTEEGLAQFFSAMEAAENSAEVTVTVGMEELGMREEMEISFSVTQDRLRIYYTTRYIWSDGTDENTQAYFAVREGAYLYSRSYELGDEDSYDDDVTYTGAPYSYSAPELLSMTLSMIGDSGSEIVIPALYEEIKGSAVAEENGGTCSVSELGQGTIALTESGAVFTFAQIPQGDGVTVRIAVENVGTNTLSFDFDEAALKAGFDAFDLRYAELSWLFYTCSDARVTETYTYGGQDIVLNSTLGGGELLRAYASGETAAAVVGGEDAYILIDSSNGLFKPGTTDVDGGLDEGVAGEVPGDASEDGAEVPEDPSEEEPAPSSGFTAELTGRAYIGGLLSGLLVNGIQSRYFTFADGSQTRFVLSAAGEQWFTYGESVTIDFNEDGSYQLTAELNDLSPLMPETVTMYVYDVGQVGKVEFPDQIEAYREFLGEDFYYLPTGRSGAQAVRMRQEMKDVVLAGEIETGGVTYTVTSLSGRLLYRYNGMVETVVIPASVTDFGNAFEDAYSLQYIYFEGTPQQYEAIANKAFYSSPAVYYYAEEEPVEEGNFWHWNEDGTAAVRWAGGEEVHEVTFDAGRYGYVLSETVYAAVLEEEPEVEIMDRQAYLIGWYTDPAFTEESKVSFPYTVTQDVTLYAKWGTGLEFGLNETETGWVVSGYRGTDPELVIPDTYMGAPVTAIGYETDRGMFYGNKTLQRVVVPDSVEYIGEGAFSECLALSEIELPDHGLYIGKSAFEGTAYYETAANWESGLLYIGRHLIEADPAVAGTSCTVRAGTLSVADYAFADCTELAEIVLPDSLTAIGAGVFEGTEYYKTLTNWTNDGLLVYGTYLLDSHAAAEHAVPAGTTLIASRAFSHNSAMKEITVPAGVQYMGRGVFLGCNLLVVCCEAESAPAGWSSAWNMGKDAVDLRLPVPVVWDCENNEVADDGFLYTTVDGIRYALCDGEATVLAQGNSEETPVTIPESVSYGGETYGDTEIAESAFVGWDSLSEANLPAGLTRIGAGAFGATQLMDVLENEAALYIDGYLIAVNPEPAGSTFEVAEGTVLIADRVFAYSDWLTSVTLPEGLQYIGADAFNYCTELSSVTLPGSLLEIGESAFAECTSLTQIAFPAALTRIGAGAFEYCYDLQFTFENTQGWYYVESDGDLQSIDVTDGWVTELLVDGERVLLRIA